MPSYVSAWIKSWLSSLLLSLLLLLLVVFSFLGRRGEASVVVILPILFVFPLFFFSSASSASFRLLVVDLIFF